jgi:hypothetical protein
MTVQSICSSKADLNADDIEIIAAVSNTPLIKRRAGAVRVINGQLLLEGW